MTAPLPWYKRLADWIAPSTVNDASGMTMPKPKPDIRVEFYQHDWIPGWAAFHDDGSIAEGSNAHVVLNLGSLMCAVEANDLQKSDLPYMIAESLCREVIHTLEAWAKVEFSEERVEKILQQYREKYGQNTIWQPDCLGENPEPKHMPYCTECDEPWTRARKVKVISFIHCDHLKSDQSAAPAEGEPLTATIVEHTDLLKVDYRAPLNDGGVE